MTYNRLGYAPTWNGQTINIALRDANNLSTYTRCLAITASGGSVSTEKAGMGNPVMSNLERARRSRGACAAGRATAAPVASASWK